MSHFPVHPNCGQSSKTRPVEGGVLHTEGADIGKQRRALRRAAVAVALSRSNIELAERIRGGAATRTNVEGHAKHVPITAESQAGRRNSQEILVKRLSHRQSAHEQAVRGDARGVVLSMMRANS